MRRTREGAHAGTTRASICRVANVKKPFWKRPRPNQPKRKLSEAQRRRARDAARKAGRRYPNLVDNACVAHAAKR
jgi:hypothetical protein